MRLPDDLVAYLDELVDQGAGSRAAVVARAPVAYRQRLTAEHDARMFQETGDYPELSNLTLSAKVDL